MSIDSITAVIPVFNSEESLPTLYSRVSATLKKFTDDYSIILVDDNSRDSSYQKICELHELDCRVKAIRLKRNYGQQNAIMCGLNYSISDYTVILDDDLQNPPEEIGKLICKILEGYEIVYGIPSFKSGPKSRILGTILRDMLFKILFDMPKGLKVSSFRILHRDLVQKIRQDKTSFVYISAIIFKNKVKAANIPVRYGAREFGRSNYNLGKLARLYLKIIWNYSSLFSGWADRSRPQYEISELRL